MNVIATSIALASSGVKHDLVIASGSAEVRRTRDNKIFKTLPLISAASLGRGSEGANLILTYLGAELTKIERALGEECYIYLAGSKFVLDAKGGLKPSPKVRERILDKREVNRVTALDVNYKKASERVLTELMKTKNALYDASDDIKSVTKELGSFYRGLNDLRRGEVSVKYVRLKLKPIIESLLDINDACNEATAKAKDSSDELRIGINNALQEIQDFKKYLTSTKFNNDNTIQVRDVLNRLEPIRDALFAVV